MAARARYAMLAATVMVAVSVEGTAGGGTSPSPKAAMRWGRVVLDAVRDANPGPTVAARAMAVVHTCMYDAWAAYDPVAVGTRLGAALRRPEEERTPAAKEEAVSRAAHHALGDLFPGLVARFDAVLSEQGFGPVTSPDDGSPAGVASRACRAVLDFRHRDGANQLGDEPNSSGRPYSDTSGYQPRNSPDQVSYPDNWQPQRVPDGQGGTKVQQFLTPHWGRVTPFAPTPPPPVRIGPPAVGSPARQAELDEMVRFSANLTDEEKVIAEYWADGPGTELPPGHWMLIGQFCSRRDTHSLDADVKLFFVLANAMLDASIDAWEQKRHFDSVRPDTLVRWTYAGQTIRAWGGPHQGTRDIDGSQWRPYIPTPPFAEYTSGHSTFSAAGAEVLRIILGRERFGASVRIPAGSSDIEPGTTPAKDVVLSWATFDDAANQAGLSRRIGGIHFISGDLAGRAAGRQVGARVAARAQQYFNGTA